MRLTDTLNDDFFVIFRGKSSKKAQHRQNHCFQRTSAALVYNLQASSLHCTHLHELSLSSLLRNFAKQNILRSAFVCRQLSLESHGSVKFGHTLCVRKFASLFRVFLQPLPVILTVLYFWEISFVQDFANKFVA